MNNFGKLRWEFEPLTLSTTFLYLNITLNNPTHIITSFQLKQPISFSTYQKEHKIYLYHLPHSAHPPGITRSLILGLLRNYWIQNTHLQDFHKMTKLLFHRLSACGHPEPTLRSLFFQAATTIDKNKHHKLLSTTNTHTVNTNTNGIFLKWRFHPHDITWKRLQHSYHHKCKLHSFSAPQGFRQLHTDHGTTMNISKLMVAYSCDQNPRELLFPVQSYNSQRMIINLLQITHLHPSSNYANISTFRLVFKKNLTYEEQYLFSKKEKINTNVLNVSIPPHVG